VLYQEFLGLVGIKHSTLITSPLISQGVEALVISEKAVKERDDLSHQKALHLLFKRGSSEVIMSFTDRQLNAMAISPKVASSLSIPGSFFIIYESILDYRNGKGSSGMKRALVGMSCVDILSSIGWFLSTWAAPVESGAPYAAGNERTCAFQGFLLQIAIGAPLYNGALVLYYLLVIKYQWSNAQLLKLEPYLHAFIWIWCLGTSIVLLSLHLLNFIGPVCWVADPPECYGDAPPLSCGNAKYFATAFFCVPLWIVILMTIYALCNIFFTVRGSVRRMSKYDLNGTRMHSMSRSSNNVKQVASRAVLYSVAFIITWTASTIWSIAQFFDYYPFWSSYLWTLLEPLQGFWNFLIFLHNRPQSKNKIKRWISCGLWKGDETSGSSRTWSWRKSKLTSSMGRRSKSARSSTTSQRGQSANEAKPSENTVEEAITKTPDEEVAATQEEDHGASEKDTEFATDL
jgi:hypothetical protein